MKGRTILLTCTALLVFGSASYAGGERPYLGVRLDPVPLPELLTKHLGLEAGQGIRISNVAAGSPADKAGIERDDIIIMFGDKKIMSHEQLVDAVAGAGGGSEVSLEVIHLGQRKTLQIKPEPMRDDVEWKYPPEPEVITSWRPGKIFKIGPDGREWMEIPFDKMPEFDVDVRKFFKELYTYHHSSTDGEDYTITIEGDPRHEDSQVIVRADGTEHRTTVGELDALPEKYREPARESVENARRGVKKDVEVRGRFRLPEPPRPEVYRKYLEALPRLDIERFSEQKDRALEKLQEQMERLQQRMQELEEQHREMFDRMLEKLEMKKERTERPEKPAPPEAESKQAI